MKIHFLKDDALSALKINLSNNVSNYHLSTNEWIYNYFQGAVSNRTFLLQKILI